MTTLSETQDAYNAKIVELFPGLTMVAVHVPQNAAEIEANKENVQVNWRVTLSYNGVDYSTDYATGIGHIRNYDNVRCWTIAGFAEMVALLSGNKQDLRTSWLKLGLNKPTLADVLYCLVSDADCGMYDFKEFCDNLGYDTDSRKAKKCHKACEKALKKMTKLFGSEGLQKLRIALQDY